MTERKNILHLFVRYHRYGTPAANLLFHEIFIKLQNKIKPTFNELEQLCTLLDFANDTNSKVEKL